MRPSATRLACAAVLLLLFVITACDHTATGPVEAQLNQPFARRGALVWVETMPLQCLSNPWQQEWLQGHGNDPSQYPHERERDILRMYFLKRGVDFGDYRKEAVADAVCAACSCPTGYAAFLQINQQDLPVFEQHSFRLSGMNLRLQADKPAFGIDEAINFQLSNPSSYSFTATGADRMGGDWLLAAQGSGFIVQQKQNGCWLSVRLPLAFEGVRQFTITPGANVHGYWLNYEKLSGTFRLLLQVHPAGDSTQMAHVISESFTVGEDLIPFDPQPRELDCGDGYSLHADSTALAGEVLCTAVSYSGGCREHEFTVHFNRIASDTAFVFIRHTANEDSCEAYLTRTRRANLQPLLVRDDFAKLILITPTGDLIRLK